MGLLLDGARVSDAVQLKARCLLGEEGGEHFMTGAGGGIRLGSGLRIASLFPGAVALKQPQLISSLHAPIRGGSNEKHLDRRWECDGPPSVSPVSWEPYSCPQPSCPRHFYDQHNPICCFVRVRDLIPELPSCVLICEHVSKHLAHLVRAFGICYPDKRMEMTESLTGSLSQRLEPLRATLHSHPPSRAPPSPGARE